MVAELKLRHALEEGERSAKHSSWLSAADVQKKYSER